MVAPSVSRLVPALWHEALSLLSTAPQHGHGSGSEAVSRSGSVARILRTRPGPASLSSSSNAARDPRGGLCGRERGAGGFRGTAAELMEGPTGYRESCKIIAAPFSAIIAVGVLVLPEVMVGITDASTTRSPASPRKRKRSSTTAMGSLASPIFAVPTG